MILTQAFVHWKLSKCLLQHLPSLLLLLDVHNFWKWKFCQHPTTNIQTILREQNVFTWYLRKCYSIVRVFIFGMYIGQRPLCCVYAIYECYSHVHVICLIGWRYLQCDFLCACRICCSRRVDCRFVLNLTNFQFVDIIVSGMDYLFSTIKHFPQGAIKILQHVYVLTLQY